ncbi:hypothetical protein AZ17_1208 [Bordetella bronchiseptica D989]|nr:hypothetical protein AZ17_1208 [Bordetella bronchiseptica D989]KDC88513.1 hypothetical protein L515_1327 [Bordetella bronchiseptica MBORD665]
MRVDGPDDAGVLAQFLGMRGAAVLREVGGRAEDDAPQGAEPPSLQAGVGQVADAHDEVEAFVGQVGEGVGELQVDVDLRVGAHVVGDDGNEEVGAEEDRGADAQGAGGRRAALGDVQAGLGDGGDGGFDAVVVGLAGFAEREAPRAAVDELDAEVLFERRQGSADGLQRAVEAARGLGEAARFGDVDEGFEVFEAAHGYLDFGDSASMSARIVCPMASI